VNRCLEHLTGREEEILRCIRGRVEDTGEGPSVRQLAHVVGMRSPASVACQLAHLERSGALIRDNAVTDCGRACGRGRARLPQRGG
jgi:repressor LexA